ncbi:hypothetical protein chiPu_0013879 [Chiloscyllium punctatum]|uniref:Uncharacterized protein n=1 Tax=Chiloscyllium punctatum TaxID=137246 RepID=A0A401SYK3_CHIPU|nr:hypothetical protein [Chiloscyllium punctatum]
MVTVAKERGRGKRGGSDRARLPSDGCQERAVTLATAPKERAVVPETVASRREAGPVHQRRLVGRLLGWTVRMCLSKLVRVKEGSEKTRSSPPAAR